MGSSENFCLRWNDFESNVSGSFRDLRAESDFFDVTLACDDNTGRTLQAHKVILSACSSFFKQMLRNMAAAAPGHPNPLIYLRGVRLTDLESILDFMYHGEVNVAQEELNSFLGVAEDLQIKGLTQQATKDGLGGRKIRKAGAGGGSAAKRARKDNNDEDELKDVNVKNEYDGGASTSTSVTDAFDSGTGTTITTDAVGTGYAEGTYDEGFDYGESGGTGGDEVVMETSMAASIEGTESTKAVTDLNELVLGLLTYADGIHTCNLCGKKSPWRTTMLRHVEANHVETAGHVCDICGQVSKTRHAFAMHKKRKHKVNMANNPLPDRPRQNQQVVVQQQQPGETG